MVKRQARAGEKIRITNPVQARGRYKKNDELIVFSQFTSLYVRCVGIPGVISRDEYIVLEKGHDYD
jgi:hypothetical protein